MLWSNSELYIDKTQRGMIHGKDLIFHTNIGDLYEYLWTAVQYSWTNPDKIQIKFKKNPRNKHWRFD